MDANSSFSRRWLDSYLAEHNLSDRTRFLSAKQWEELRMLSHVYRSVASQYLSEDKFSFYFHHILSFIFFAYKANKSPCTVQEDDLFWYFTWMYRKGFQADDLLTAANCITDFYHVLLQEGIIKYNPLFKIYRMFLSRESILNTMKMESIMLKFASLKDSESASSTHQLLDNKATATDQAIPPPLSAQEYHEYYSHPRLHFRTLLSRTYKPIVLIVGIFMAGYFFIMNNEPTPRPGNPVLELQANAPIHSQKNQQDKIIKYFYENNMKHYYCNNYLSIKCDEKATTLNPMAAELDSISEGWQYYVEFCLRCHGETGRGNGRDVHLLRSPPPTLGWSGSQLLERDAFLFWIIAEGGHSFGGEMPRFKDFLNQEKIWKIILFVKTLR
ncbi:c-type cytochrome [Candidatus Magnetaquicoccus inordinatus]|uniref:c-type cytochrome n=1 Tax=Candidatus Magnetaquicoccus inordinatus TaxID=2496818 RepID=UPI00102AA002|nr:c-type cytochrome [Candidatus Magnetaquicoccus inordinatus]